MPSNRLLRLAALSCCFLFAARSLQSQNITGAILGTVTDPSGASIPRAKISIVATETNIRNETVTNDRGDYEVPLLRPGAYRIIASGNGFQTVERQGIQLSVGNRLQVNLTLPIGQTSESVVVTGSAELVESGTASLGNSLGAKAIEELPLRGRYVLQYAALAPGVQINPQAVGAGGGGLTNADFSVNGGRFRTNELLVDGVSSSLPRNNDFGVLPLPEGVVEMKIHTNAFSAEFGRTGGGVFNVVTKGGGNQFHGSAFEFLSADELSANAWFSNARGQRKGNSRRNIFGASVSGPILRNKTFFYADFQATKSSGTGATGTATVPIEAFRNGDFSRLVTAAGQAKVLYDPITTRLDGTTYSRLPFAGNQIPAARIDPVTRNVIKLYPQPNSAGTGPAQVNNFNYTQPSRSSNEQYTGRVDHEFSSNHRLFGRYSTQSSRNTVFPDYGTLGDTLLGFSPGNRGYSAALNDTYTISPTMLLNTRLGFTRLKEIRTPLHEGIKMADLGFDPALDAVRLETSLPNFAPAGYGALGPASGDRIRLANDIWHLNSDLTIIRSAHSLKFGAEGRLYNQNSFQAGGEQGVFSFSPAFTQGPNPQQATATAGDSIASFLLGLGGGSITSTPRLAIRNTYWALFVNDDWKVSKRLTLNLGLRYEVEEPRTERYNRFSTFDFTRAFPIPVPGLPGLKGVLTHPGVDGEPRTQLDASRLNFSPRFGFAYRITERTVLRGGYGIFYSPVFGSTAPNSFGVAGAQITTPWVASLDGVTPLNYLNNPFPNGALISSTNPVDVTQMGLGAIVTDRRNRNNIYTQQWNLNLQRELPGHFLIEAAYAGNKGTRLPVGIQFNQLDPVYQPLGSALTALVPNPFFGIVREGALAASTVQRGQLLRPFPHYQGLQTFMQNRADSVYHSLNVKLERRFSNGFLGQVSYTNGKIIDNSSGRLVNYTDFVPPVQNAYDLRAERSISEGDVSQRLVIFGDWELPFGKGKKFASDAGRALNYVIGGWSASAWATFQTGFPISLTSLGNTGVYGATTRPNSAGRSAAKNGPPQDRLTAYFDTTAFTQPPAFTFGNTARTLPDVRGPGRAQTDVTLQKDVPITERVLFRLRAECYNITNTPFFDQPADIVGNANLGVISAARLQRGFQIAGKLVW